MEEGAQQQQQQSPSAEKKRRVAIIGVTGSVGQEFVQSLGAHPWFEVTQIAASERSAGKNYLDATRDASGTIAWDVGGEIPEYIKSMTVRRIDELDTPNLDLVFSAVESKAARDIETRMAAILPVVSTSSAYRHEEDVPMLVPGINDAQADLPDVQGRNRDWKGWVAQLPNRTTTGLAIALKPLLDRYGAKRVLMTSLRAISGGGKTGVAAMGITDSTPPYMPKEEGKVKKETGKILGTLNGGKIEDAGIGISCTRTRVPVIDVHTESVFVETGGGIDPQKAKGAYHDYNQTVSIVGLPSAPRDYAFHEDPTRPQPRMERTVGDGMTATVGRVEKEELFENGLRYVLFSHNKKMGSAKGAVLLAEMLYTEGKI